MLSNAFIRSRKISKACNYIIKRINYIDYGTVNRAYTVSTTYVLSTGIFYYLITAI